MERPGQIALQRVREARRMKKGGRESKGVREIVGMWEGGRGTEMGQRGAQVGVIVGQASFRGQRVEGKPVIGASGCPLPQFQAAK